MKFVNAYLSEEEKQIISKARLRDPRYKISQEYLNPSRWTIDRDNSIALMYCGVLDRDDYFKEVFTLVYKYFDNNYMLNFILVPKYYSREEELKLRELYGVELVKKWKLIGYEIPSKLEKEISVDLISEILTEALSAYGVNGNPEHELNVKAVIEIDGGSV